MNSGGSIGGCVLFKEKGVYERGPEICAGGGRGVQERWRT